MYTRAVVGCSISIIKSCHLGWFLIYCTCQLMVMYYAWYDIVAYDHAHGEPDDDDDDCVTDDQDNGVGGSTDRVIAEDQSSV